ncbi:hypothetical protein [Anaerotignum sp.]|uniref:hypothetical protein n=1 Tax=Anaerotignum sp. TaxID=2039241 RepID=UPI00289D9ECC|nr:hypothetical protein [Anaerotignum sp.]
MNQEEMAVRISEIDSREKSNTKRIDKIEERQENLEKLTEAVSVMQNEQKHTNEKVDRIELNVDKLVEKPAKRWESVVEKAITVVVGAVVGYFLSGGRLP